ncbi:hypothetical protein [Azospirillum doebereinerae]|uniref:Uncharacterized protein n=1 Tax=Azospirillum doebereinerae TaxID=92933 RepID=A0A433JFE7_9PROT|nr:hypothetical protein [Azospirillum doebereinerae]RUQ75868.1 hypothetical protein EJ913_01780 [Azospirillum doebereinerae]
MTHAVTIEKRDASGRLIARLAMAGGTLNGPCVFFAEDGETVLSTAVFRDGRPVLPDPLPGPTPSALPPRPPVAAGDLLF